MDDDNEKNFLIIKNLETEVSDLANKLKETKKILDISNCKLKKIEKDYDRVLYREKIFIDKYEFYKYRYYRLIKTLNKTVQEKEKIESKFLKQSDTMKNNVITSPYGNIVLDRKITPQYQILPYLRTCREFEQCMRTIIKMDKIDNLDIFKKLLQCVWNYRGNDVFTIEDLKNKYDFNNVPRTTMYRYIDLLIESEIIKRICKGHFQVLF